MQIKMVIELRQIVGQLKNNRKENMTTKNDPMENSNEKKFFIVEKYIGYQTERYNIHNQKMYDLTTAVKKLLALDTLNEDRKRTSYHLQEVNFSVVSDEHINKSEEPEVKEDKNWKECVQEDLPF